MAAIHNTWTNKLQQYLKLYIEAFLNVNVNPALDVQIRQDLAAHKVIRAYINATKHDESFRITSKSRLFFTFRDVISSFFVQTMKNRIQKQIGEIGKWMNLSLQDVDTEFVSYLKSFYLPITKDSETSTVNVSPRHLGNYLHNTYGIPLIIYLLPELHLDPASNVVCSPGRIPHVKIPGCACTPDLLVVDNEEALYNDINQCLMNWGYKSPTGYGLKFIVEIKTYHKIHVDKTEALSMYNKIIQNIDVKDDLLQLLYFMMLKQQITVDYQVDGKRKRNECFAKNCILYPADKYEHTAIDHKDINKFGFLRGLKPQKQYSLDNICGENTQGRLWIMFYNPRTPDKVPMKHVLFNKSPYLFTPCSNVFYQMLEQRCVLQYHNPDVISLLVGIFSLEADDKNSAICPSIAFALEVTYDTFVTASFEESIVRLMCEEYPQMFQHYEDVSMTQEEVDKHVKDLVWSKEEHKKRSVCEETKQHVVKVF